MTRVVTLGEMLLRLKSPQAERLLQSPRFEATFGGSEANVAISLARFGLEAAIVTVLPDNPIGDACLGELRRHGVDTALIQRGGERLGLYYFEHGANQRPSTVVYDRAHSSMAEADLAQFDWDRIFSGADWFHCSGITPAISQRAADYALAAVRAARARGLIVSCDCNGRGKLWKYGKFAHEVLPDLVRCADVLFATAFDALSSLGIAPESDASPADADPQGPGHDTLAADASLGRRIFLAFPNLKYQAITHRASQSANHTRWSGSLYDGTQLICGTTYDITHIVDRVGTGDAFAAGLIFGLATGMESRSALEHALAASTLKHSIPGDINLVTLAEVQSLIAGNRIGGIQR